VLVQQPHKEIAFGFFPGIPINQAIPAVRELFDVFLLVMVGFADAFWSLPEALRITRFR
jgi:hypothetical protein